MRRLLILAGLFVVVAALAGCGGSGSDSTAEETTASGSGEALTKAEFIEQADAVCEDHAAEREELQEQAAELAEEVNAGDDQAREELADLLAEAAGNAGTEYGELHDLIPPSSDAVLIGNMLSTADDQVGLTEEAVDALREKDYKTFTALTVEAGKLKARATRIAVAYGFEVCGTEVE